MTNWQPWYFINLPKDESSEIDLSQQEFVKKAFQKETAADFDVFLFAQRQD